ncbi:hypothetical protein SNK03_001245 [Fusarium graminearum]
MANKGLHFLNSLKTSATNVGKTPLGMYHDIYLGSDNYDDASSSSGSETSDGNDEYDDVGDSTYAPRQGVTKDVSTNGVSKASRRYVGKEIYDDSDNEGNEEVHNDNEGDEEVHDDNEGDEEVHDDSEGDEEVHDDNEGDEEVHDDSEGDEEVHDDSEGDEEVHDDDDDDVDNGCITREYVINDDCADDPVNGVFKRFPGLEDAPELKADYPEFPIYLVEMSVDDYVKLYSAYRDLAIHWKNWGHRLSSNERKIWLATVSHDGLKVSSSTNTLSNHRLSKRNISWAGWTICKVLFGVDSCMGSKRLARFKTAFPYADLRRWEPNNDLRPISLESDDTQVQLQTNSNAPTQKKRKQTTPAATLNNNANEQQGVDDDQREALEAPKRRKTEDIRTETASPQIRQVLSDSHFNLENIMTGLVTRMNDNLVARIDARFDTFGARFDAFEARFGAFEARFDAFEARFNAIEARLNAFGARLDAFAARFSALAARLDALAARLN